jgi:hypothetical protein
VGDLEFRSLGDTNERLIRLSRDDAGDGFVTTWNSLTARQQLVIARGLAALVADMRSERRDPPDSAYESRG